MPDTTVAALLGDLGLPTELLRPAQTVITRRAQSGQMLKTPRCKGSGRFHSWRKDDRRPLSERNSRDPVPVRACTRAESELAHPGVPHYWLCDGRLLVLTDPANESNMGLFKVRKKKVTNISVQKNTVFFTIHYG